MTRPNNKNEVLMILDQTGDDLLVELCAIVLFSIVFISLSLLSLFAYDKRSCG